MPDPIRHQALTLLNQLENSRHTLDGLLDAALEASPVPSRRDRNFIYALTHGTLRWQGRLDWVLDQFSKRPIKKTDPVVRNILRLGLFQILFMDRVPDSAAVNTSVDLAKTEAGAKVTGFVNAVLRNAIRGHQSIELPDAAVNPVAALAVQTSFSPWMIKRWIERMGYDETADMANALNTIAPLILRTNTLKTKRRALLAAMEAAEEKPIPTPGSPLGLTFAGINRAVIDLPGFDTGAFQVQDEAAQLVTYLVDARPGDRVLDACAGLGGKTGHIAQQMKNTGHIRAVDMHPDKLKRLGREMQRLGIVNVSTQVVDLDDAAATRRLGTFDRVLLDAPCSGLGVLRRHPDGKWRHGHHSLLEMAQRQKKFLDHLAPAVKPGGVLLYVVCSNEPEENEDVINHFLNNHTDFKISPALPYLPDTAQHLATPKGYFRSLVHRHNMDGFFAVRFKKRQAGQNLKNRRTKPVQTVS